jgi:cytochrome c oxidase subunit 1
MLHAIGVLVVFIIGGMTGVMIASVPFDLQVHDTYFIVAHFHYVILGGVLFPLFGACYLYFPKITGRLMSETLGRWHFWLFFVGVNVTFFPMHLLGLDGMPRRVYTYLPEMGWGRLNLISSLGAVVIVSSVAVFLCNVIASARTGAVAGANPWGAPGLEWATSSPPPSTAARGSCSAAAGRSSTAPAARRPPTRATARPTGSGRRSARRAGCAARCTAWA